MTVGFADSAADSTTVLFLNSLRHCGFGVGLFLVLEEHFLTVAAARAVVEEDGGEDGRQDYGQDDYLLQGCPASGGERGGRDVAGVGLIRGGVHVSCLHCHG